ncbi:MAG: hypothetical protein JW786_08690 [Desulfobacterales bacterium]|nr:hypothetical protein [Desulfobacterales bacterium]
MRRRSGAPGHRKVPSGLPCSQSELLPSSLISPFDGICCRSRANVCFGMIAWDLLNCRPRAISHGDHVKTDNCHQIRLTIHRASAAKRVRLIADVKL